MSNIKMIIKNDFDDAALTATPATVATLNETNMQRIERSRVMRTTGTSQTITAVMPGARIANGFSLAGYTFTVTAVITLTLKLASTVVYTGTVNIAASLIPLGVWRAGIDAFGGFSGDELEPIATLWFDSVLYDEAIITINDGAANTDGYFDVWRIFLGQSISPKINFSYGAKLTWLDDVQHFRTSAGSLRSDGDGRYRQFTIDLSYLDADDRIQLETDLIKSRRGNDLLVSGYPETGGINEMLHTMIAKRDEHDGFTHNFYNNNTMQLIFLEC